MLLQKRWMILCRNSKVLLENVHAIVLPQVTSWIALSRLHLNVVVPTHAVPLDKYDGEVLVLLVAVMLEMIIRWDDPSLMEGTNLIQHPYCIRYTMGESRVSRSLVHLSN